MVKEMGIPYVFNLKDGEMLSLKKEPEVLTTIESGILAVDGHQIIPLNAQVLKKRRKMMDEGTAVLTLAVDSKARLLGEPQLSTLGFALLPIGMHWFIFPAIMRVMIYKRCILC